MPFIPLLLLAIKLRECIKNTYFGDKTYHIDYVYLKGLETIQLDVGNYNDWVKLSNHVPIITELIE
jgi:hypothetical protein